MSNTMLPDHGDLDAMQTIILATVLDMMIPASSDGRLPSAANVGFAAFAHSLGNITWLRAGLATIVEDCKVTTQADFIALASDGQLAYIEGAKRKYNRFFGELLNLLIQCYYQDDRVMRAVGMEARSPFPLGYFPIDGDLSLLEPVYERGKIYRD